MAHIEDRWWTDKKDPLTGVTVRNADDSLVRVKSERHGIGLRYRVRFLDPDGNERSRSFADKKLTLAKEFKTKMENDVLAGVYKNPGAGDILTKQWARTYLKGRSQDLSSQITLNIIFGNQILPFLGDRRLRNLNPTAIRDWKEWMTNESKISVNYQADAWDNLSAMLDAAVAENLIDENPCRSKSISPPKRILRRIVPWSYSKLDMIETALPKKYGIGVPICAGLGLRIGEFLAFSTKKIDRANLTYLCDRQIVYRKGKLYFKLPKGHKVRVIPIAGGLLERIDEYAAVFPSATATLPWAEQDGRDFDTVDLAVTNGSNDPWRASMWGHDVWHKAFKEAGIEYEKQWDGMHALRHLFASHMLSQGVSIKELAEYLGHSSEAFTLKTYVHMTPSSHDRARLAVNAMFPPSNPNQGTVPKRQYRLRSTRIPMRGGPTANMAVLPKRARTAP